jgi:two-component system OmpR family response regulator
MRVLLIEDDAAIAALVQKGLKQAGHESVHASNGISGLSCMRESVWDAAVVDIMLPGMDGLSLVQAARHEGLAVPIIFLSAKRELDDRVRGLKAGGDDYLVKPFAFSELLARLEALARRARGVSEPLRLHAGDIEMDLVRRKVTRAGREVVLQPREFALLEYLLRQQGHVVARHTLIEHVWDYSFDPATSVVETTISRLRTKLMAGFEGQREAIRTVRGVGYVIDR